MRVADLFAPSTLLLCLVSRLFEGSTTKELHQVRGILVLASPILLRLPYQILQAALEQLRAQAEYSSAALQA